MPKLSAELLSVLRCPVTGSPLVQDGDELVSASADESGQTLRYRIEDGIPLLLPPAAPTATPGKPGTGRQDGAPHGAAPLPASE